MKYIDADSFANTLQEEINYYDANYFYDRADGLRDALEDLKAAPVMELLHCEKCKHYIVPDDGNGYCAITHIAAKTDGYCYMGKEK